MDTGSSRGTAAEVSVVLCTFNGERYLASQLDSLLQQTRLPDQIVVSDDDSSDGTWTMLQDFAEHARSLGIEIELGKNSDNLGYAGNFSAALAKATGEIVFLCDQDDVWHPGKIARMVAEFEARPELGLLHTDASLVDREGSDLGYGLFAALEVSKEELQKLHRGEAFEVLLRRNLVTGATMGLRKTHLGKLLPVPEGWPHDEWLGLGVSLVSCVDCLEWPSIQYRQHGGNQIGVRRRTTVEKVTGHGRPDKRAYMHQLVDRLVAMLDWSNAQGMDLPSRQIVDIQARIAHAQARANLPDRAIERSLAVLDEARTRRYGRYSSGLRSIMSDLLDLN